MVTIVVRNKMNKKVLLNIIGMHCSTCSINIDGKLEDTDGVSFSATSYSKQQTEVSFDPNKITPQKIIAIIKGVGYDAKVESLKL